MTTGERIKMRRKQHGLTVDQVAERVGVNRATIYRYESAEIKNMGTETLVPLAAALRTTPAWLLNGDEAEQTEEMDAIMEQFYDKYHGLMKKMVKMTPEDMERIEKIVDAFVPDYKDDEGA